MTKTHVEKVAESLSKSIAEAIADSDSFWSAAEAEITAQMQAAQDQGKHASLAIDKDGNASVCVDLFGLEDFVVIPLRIYGPDMPYRPDYTNQVEGAQDEIAALRAFAKKLNDKADKAQSRLDAILEKGRLAEQRTRPDFNAILQAVRAGIPEVSVRFFDEQWDALENKAKVKVEIIWGDEGDGKSAHRHITFQDDENHLVAPIIISWVRKKLGWHT